jgi:ABC-type spermidine/putrescine transport system permease subunit I
VYVRYLLAGYRRAWLLSHREGNHSVFWLMVPLFPFMLAVFVCMPSWRAQVKGSTP